MAETPKQDWRGRLFIGLLRFFAWWPLRVNHAMGTAIGYLLWCYRIRRNAFRPLT